MIKLFWEIVIFLIAWTIGQITGAYTVIMPLCCLRMGIPFANRIQRVTGIDMRQVKKGYRISVLVWLVIDAIILFLLIRFVPSLYIYAVGGGTLVSLFLGFRQTGLNQNNLSDFMQSALPKLSKQDQETLIEYVEQL